MDKIQMVDLIAQYKDLQNEIDKELTDVLESGYFIGGPKVLEFKENLSKYLHVKNTITCGNGTDALQIALMAIGAQPGDEVLVPSFTFVATAEVIGLLGLIPIMVDVEIDTFNIRIEDIESRITNRTRAIIPVHLYGQCANMKKIVEIANIHGLYIIEDNAQAIGADYFWEDGTKQKAGTIGHIGCTSFYPSKNLGAFGDGGAIFTNDDLLARKINMIANHGQNKQYYHKILGVNSRLDAIQAAILNIKLKHIDSYHSKRNQAANYYDKRLSNIENLIVPHRSRNSTHVFHQYTLRITNGNRDGLKKYLAEKNIPSMIYYPVPLYRQEAYKDFWDNNPHKNTELLSDQVLSLPMHTELSEKTLDFICSNIEQFFN